MKSSQNGFIGIILVIVIALAVTGGGTYLYSQKKELVKNSTAESRVLERVSDKESERSFVDSSSSTSAQAELKNNKVETKITDGIEARTDVVVSSRTVEKTSPSFSYKADITTTENCGYETCFKEKFRACELATASVEITMIAAEYKIIGKGTNGCDITFKYTIYPDPSWVNKEMTCEFDNKVSFEDSMQKVFSGVTTGEVVCKGPLYDILKPR